IHASGRALAGDVLALAGGMFAAGYMVAGGVVRRHVGTVTYTTVCYTTTAIVLLTTCVVGGVSLHGYPAGAGWRIVATTAGAPLPGHALFNRALRTTRPTVVSLALLFEVPGAAVLALLFLHQHPPASAVPGIVVLLLGIAILVTGRDRGVEPPEPVQ